MAEHVLFDRLVLDEIQIKVNRIVHDDLEERFVAFKTAHQLLDMNQQSSDTLSDEADARRLAFGQWLKQRGNACFGETAMARLIGVKLEYDLDFNRLAELVRIAARGGVISVMASIAVTINDAAIDIEWQQP